jgi:hypothetical protein
MVVEGKRERTVDGTFRFPNLWDDQNSVADGLISLLNSSFYPCLIHLICPKSLKDETFPFIRLNLQDETKNHNGSRAMGRGFYSVLPRLSFIYAAEKG